MRTFLAMLLAVLLTGCGTPPRRFAPNDQPTTSTWTSRQAPHPGNPRETMGKIGLLNAWAATCGIAPIERVELLNHARRALGADVDSVAVTTSAVAQHDGSGTRADFCEAVTRETSAAPLLLDRGGADAALASVPSLGFADRFRTYGAVASILPYCPGGMPNRDRYREMALAELARMTGADMNLIAGVFDGRASRPMTDPTASLCDASRRLEHTVLRLPPPRPTPSARPPAPAVSPKAPEPKRPTPGAPPTEIDI